MKPYLVSRVGFLFLFFNLVDVFSATITWTNVNGGSWSNPAHWSPNQVPGAADSAVITAPGTYTVALDATAAVASLTLGGATGTQTLAFENDRQLSMAGSSVVRSNGVLEVAGRVECQGALTVDGLVLWSRGVITGAVTVASSGRVTVDTTGTHEFVGTMNNNGLIRWTGGAFYLELDTAFTNAPGGTFVIETDGTLDVFGGTQNRFINHGTFRQSAGASESFINVVFSNTGTVDIQNGTIHFRGFTSSGRFDVAAGATLSLLSGVFTLEPGHLFAGAGTYGVTSAGTATVIGDLAAPNFQLAGGTLVGTNRLTGTLDWTGGFIRGALTVAAGGTLNLETAGTHEFFGVLTNSGTIRWTGGAFYLEDASTLVNLPNAVFSNETNNQILPFGRSPNRFINQGLFRKSVSTGDTTVRVEFNNTGTVDVQSGTLDFPDGFTSTGLFQVAAGARLSLSSGTFTFGAGHRMTGAGFYGIERGTVTIVGDLGATNFLFTSGTLLSTNRITGTLRWTGGILRGAFTVAAGGTLLLENSANFELFGTLRNAGTVQWQAGTFYLEDVSTFINEPEGTFDMLADGQLLPFGVEPNRFINQGIFRKSGGTGTTIVSVDFANAGAIDIKSGTLLFQDGFTQTAGSTLLNGGNLTANQPIQVQGGTFGGTGRVSATVTNSGQLTPGLSPGRLELVGNYIQTPAGTMNIELAGLTQDAFDQFAVNGAAQIDGLLQTTLIRGFAPPRNSAFAFLTATTLDGRFARHTYPSNQLELNIQYAPTGAVLQVVNVFTNVSQFPPVLAAIPNQTIDELSLLRLTATATDADVPANVLTFRLDSAPPAATIDPISGILTWTPTEAQGPGNYPFTVRVTDNGALFDTKTFNVAVRELNQAPTLAPVPPQRVAPGRTLTFIAQGTDADLPPQTLTFSLDGSVPAGATINPATGQFTWNVPASQPAGIVSVTIRVTDNAAPPLSATQTVPVDIDRAGPRVAAMVPSGQVSTVLDHVEVQFSETIDASSFDASDVEFTGPDGLLNTSVSVVSSNVFRISFISLTRGDYTLKIGTNVLDTVGNLLNQDNDTVNGEPAQDVFVGQLSVGLADLSVSAITAPAQASLGQPIEVIWTVANLGNAPALGPWSDLILLIDKTGLAADHVLAVPEFEGTIPVGQSLTRTQSVILPAGVFGPRFIKVRADHFNQVAEGANESNNETEDDRAIQIAAADLVVTSVGAPATAQFGQTITVSWTVRNAGTGTASGAWRDNLYLSPDSNSVSAATLLFSSSLSDVAVAAGGTYTRTQPVTLPLDFGLAPGNYFIVVAADADSVQPEGNEDNNFGSRSLAVAAPPLPDLVVRDIIATSTAVPGQPVVLRWTVANQGSREASGPWVEAVSFLNQPVFATFTFSNTLAAGAALLRTQSVTVPVNGAAGALRVLVEVDSNQDITENNETNNVAQAVGITTVPQTLSLTTAASEIAENAVTRTIAGTVTRNGERTNALTVTLQSSDPTELTVPASVTISAGQVTALFELTVQRDGIVDGPQRVTVNAAAQNFTGATTVPITVLDSDLPRLAITFAPTNIVEPTNVIGTVTRDIITSAPLMVQLTSSDPLQFSVPEQVLIPANATSVTFVAQAIGDTLVEAPQTYSVTAEADGLLPGTGRVQVTDDDIPQISIAVALTEISEGAGPLATTATLTRTPNNPRSLVVAVESSNINAARVPTTVTIPAGEASVTFPVAAVNNSAIDGTKTAALRAFLNDPGSGVRLATAAPATLRVTDDDGPTLHLELNRALVAEGLSSAATATVSRNSSSAAALTVNLASSDVSELTVPATVTIPSNQSSATFTVASVADGTTDGDQPVTLTASAAGFTPASALLTVTDRMLPDLTVSVLNPPTNGATDASVQITFRFGNDGLATATGSMAQNVYLSSDAVVGDDTLIDQAVFTGSLVAGGRLDQTLTVRLPAKTGDYWLVVTADSADSVSEALENNNTAISAQPIRVEKAYGATVETDVTVAPAGTPIPLRGRATLISGQPAPFSLVNIHLGVQGTKRIISALTDQDGRYAIVFQPLPGEGGRYDVGADHPGVSTTPVQDTFTLLGLRVTPQESPIRVLEGRPTSSSAVVENLSDIPLAGLRSEVVEKPANVQVTVSLTNATLPGLGQVTLDYTLSATDTSSRSGTVVIRLSHSSGVTNDLRLPITIESPRPQLVAEPGSLQVGMKRGGQTSVQLQLANVGGAASGTLDVLPPVIPWLTVASGTHLESLPPGATNVITLLLTPPADLPLGDHSGTMVISGAGANLSVPFTFRALSESVGSVRIIAEDEYTYYAAGSPKVTNAVVRLTDPLTAREIATGRTDARGELLLTNLFEAYYRIDVKADGHGSHNSTFLLVAGKTNTVTAFLPRETIKYIWTVVPTEIEDRTEIVIEAVFETVVPVPVITVEPMLIDLIDFQGSVTQVNLKITNHGLLAAENVRLRFDEHPDISATPLVNEIGVLKAKSSITMPLTLRRLSPGAASAAAAGSPAKASVAGRAAASSGGGCNLGGETLYDLLCGPTKRTYGTPVVVQNVKGGCGIGAGGVLAGGFAGLTGAGGLGFGGGGVIGDQEVIYIPPSEVNTKTPCNLCPLKALAAGVDCALKFLLNDGTKCAKDLYACLSGPPNSATLYKCFKSIYSCGKVAGAAVPGAGVVSNLKYLECLKGMLSACDKTAAAQRIARASLGDSRSGRARQATEIEAPELKPLSEHVSRLQKIVDVDLYVWGSPIWFEDLTGASADWIGAFLALVEENTTDGAKVSASERGALLARPFPAGVTAADANNLVDRWNRTMDYWNAGIFNLADVPAGQNRDFVAFDQLQQKTALANEAILQSEAEGYASVAEGAEDARQELVRFYQKDAGGGDCATVRLRIEQQAVLTRDAFDATLEIINSTAGALEDISVELTIQRENGEVVTSLFGIRPPVLSGLTSVDGVGVIGPNSTGKASWILIPTSDAAPTNAAVFLVSGRLRYRQGDLPISIPLAPAAISVLPSPSLKVKYFNQRDVFSDDPFTPEIEPSIPYSLGVLVQNAGYGAARNFRITSAQPKIIENEKGLLIDFDIIATEVAGQNLTPSLTANFGNIGAGEVAVGRWLFRSSLQGLFTEYEASFEHLDSLGDPRLSLIDSVTIHELNHVVRAHVPVDDGKFDFLANDVPDLEDMPDTLHLSDGRIEPVSLVRQASVTGSPSAPDRSVQLTAVMPPGWAYLRVADPASGQFRLARVLRSNGSEVSLDDNVWTTDRTFIGNAERPIRENVLHLLDFNSSGSYTLVYEESSGQDNTPPASSVEALPAQSSAQIPVRWSGDDGSGAGVEHFDVFVSINGGPFNFWLQRTTRTGALYEGTQNDRYAFYSVATDRAGNQEAPATTPDAQTVVALINQPPVLTLPAVQTVNEGEVLTLAVPATDPDVPANTLLFSLEPGAPSGVVIDPSTGAITWTTGEGNGPSTNRIAVRVADNGLPSLSATGVVSVIVREVNQAPQLDAIDEQTINEGEPLTIQLTANDPDLPANQVSFRLGPDAPPGAALSPAGAFSWTPTALQGPSTNQIVIIAADNGVPSLTATQTMVVVVRDALGDFTLSLGSTNILAGQKGSVPVVLASAVDLTNLSFTLELPVAGLTNPTVRPLIGDIASASLQQLSSNRFKLQFVAARGRLLQGNQPVAQLDFEALASAASAVVPLQLSELVGERSTGVRLTRATAYNGRVTLIGRQAVLDVARATAPALVLYGRPGLSFAVEYNADLRNTNGWRLLTRVAQTNTFVVIPGLVGTNANVFYRAVEFAAQPALAELRRTSDGSVSLLFYGEAGRQYDVETLADLPEAGSWIPQWRITLTNSFQFIDLPDRPSASHFYRIRAH